MKTPSSEILEPFLTDVQSMKLHVSPAFGAALKKPLLILLLLARIDRSEAQENRFSFSEVREELASLIREFGGRAAKSGPRPEQPFSHLRSSPFWQLTLPRTYPLGKTIPISVLSRHDSFAALPGDLFRVLHKSRAARERVVSLILDQWWPETLHEELRGALGFGDFATAPQAPRDPAFVRTVLENYRYSCAFCGFHGLINGQATGVDAGHIRWRSFDGPDTLENGFALCKLHHWALDRGILTLSDRNTIRVSSAFSAPTDGGLPLERLDGQRPAVEPRRIMPSEAYLHWHRTNVFLGD